MPNNYSKVILGISVFLLSSVYLVNTSFGQLQSGFNWNSENYPLNKSLSEWMTVTDNFQRSQLMGFFNIFPASGTAFILDSGESTNNPNACGFFLNGAKGERKTLVAEVPATVGGTIDVKGNYDLFKNAKYIDKEGRQYTVNVVAQVSGPKFAPTSQDSMYKCGVIIYDPRLPGNPPIQFMKVSTTQTPKPSPTPTVSPITDAPNTR